MIQPIPRLVVVRLRTGYEVPIHLDMSGTIIDDDIDHLYRALFGEAFLPALREYGPKKPAKVLDALYDEVFSIVETGGDGIRYLAGAMMIKHTIDLHKRLRRSAARSMKARLRSLANGRGGKIWEKSQMARCAHRHLGFPIRSTRNLSTLGIWPDRRNKAACTAGTCHPALSFDHHGKETCLSCQTLAVRLLSACFSVDERLLEETGEPQSRTLPTFLSLQHCGPGK
jgi:hypothetical protein